MSNAQKEVDRKRVTELLTQLMALKDLYNDISTRFNRGYPVSKRILQLHSDLSAVLTAARFAAQDPTLTTGGKADQSSFNQLGLPFAEPESPCETNSLVDDG